MLVVFRIYSRNANRKNKWRSKYGLNTSRRTFLEFGEIARNNIEITFFLIIRKTYSRLPLFGGSLNTQNAYRDTDISIA